MNNRLFARRYAEITRRKIYEASLDLGQEAWETEKMARSFFQLLEAKLDLQNRKDPPTEEEVREAVEQLKDVGRFGIFVALVIIPGGVVSLMGLELLARRFGIRTINLIPSSFRKRNKHLLPDIKQGSRKPEDDHEIEL